MDAICSPPRHRIYIVYNNEFEQMRVPKALVIGALVAVGVGFAVVHAIHRFTTVFQVFFGVLAVLCAIRLGVHYNQVKNPRARALARSYIYFSLVGFGFWLMDYHYCHVMRGLPVNPQGHAWCVRAFSRRDSRENHTLSRNLHVCCRWHIFMGLSTYHGPVFMQYVRMEQLQKKVEIRDTLFGIQTIVVKSDDDSNPKSKTL